MRSTRRVQLCDSVDKPNSKSNRKRSNYNRNNYTTGSNYSSQQYYFRAPPPFMQCQPPPVPCRYPEPFNKILDTSHSTGRLLDPRLQSNKGQYSQKEYHRQPSPTSPSSLGSPMDIANSDNELQPVSSQPYAKQEIVNVQTKKVQSDTPLSVAIKHCQNMTSPKSSIDSVNSPVSKLLTESPPVRKVRTHALNRRIAPPKVLVSPKKSDAVTSAPKSPSISPVVNLNLIILTPPSVSDSAAFKECVHNNSSGLLSQIKDISPPTLPLTVPSFPLAKKNYSSPTTPSAIRNLKPIIFTTPSLKTQPKEPEVKQPLRTSQPEPSSKFTVHEALRNLTKHVKECNRADIDTKFHVVWENGYIKIPEMKYPPIVYIPMYKRTTEIDLTEDSKVKVKSMPILTLEEQTSTYTCIVENDISTPVLESEEHQDMDICEEEILETMAPVLPTQTSLIEEPNPTQLKLQTPPKKVDRVETSRKATCEPQSVTTEVPVYNPIFVDVLSMQAPSITSAANPKSAPISSTNKESTNLKSAPISSADDESAPTTSTNLKSAHISSANQEPTITSPNNEEAAVPSSSMNEDIYSPTLPITVDFIEQPTNAGLVTSTSSATEQDFGQTPSSTADIEEPAISTSSPEISPSSDPDVSSATNMTKNVANTEKSSGNKRNRVSSATTDGGCSERKRKRNTKSTKHPYYQDLSKEQQVSLVGEVTDLLSSLEENELQTTTRVADVNTVVHVNSTCQDLMTMVLDWLEHRLRQYGAARSDRILTTSNGSTISYPPLCCLRKSTGVAHILPPLSASPPALHVLLCYHHIGRQQQPSSLQQPSSYADILSRFFPSSSGRQTSQLVITTTMGSSSASSSASSSNSIPSPVTSASLPDLTNQRVENTSVQTTHNDEAPEDGEIVEATQLTTTQTEPQASRNQSVKVSVYSPPASPSNWCDQKPPSQFWHSQQQYRNTPGLRNQAVVASSSVSDRIDEDAVGRGGAMDIVGVEGDTQVSYKCLACSFACVVGHTAVGHPLRQGLDHEIYMVMFSQENRCKWCNRDFSSPDCVVRHWVREHIHLTKMIVYECNICKMSCTSLPGFAVHLDQVHCNLPGNTFDVILPELNNRVSLIISRSAVALWSRLMLQAELNKTNDDGLRFDTISSVQQISLDLYVYGSPHSRSHRLCYICIFCRIVFITYDCAKDHQTRRKHRIATFPVIVNVDPVLPTKFECILCRSQSQLRLTDAAIHFFNHVRDVETTMEFWCGCCRFSFEDVWTMIHHLARNHLGRLEPFKPVNGTRYLGTLTVTTSGNRSLHYPIHGTMDCSPPALSTS